MESKRRNENAVCVTGASGFIASWLVKLLLLRGYVVKATVRDPNDSKKAVMVSFILLRQFLLMLKILSNWSKRPASEKCSFILTELIDPAVKGTLNVLKSCAKSPSLKRVILTSSMATVIYNGKPRNPEVVVDETWFSNQEFCNEYEARKYTLFTKQSLLAQFTTDGCILLRGFLGN
ncbi:hypothetical protein K1719_046528 [Acacia pycnantha]|nr:hypothetical protein K1719_046528 [Acacia pycnantha]